MFLRIVTEYVQSYDGKKMGTIHLTVQNKKIFFCTSESTSWINKY